MAKRIEARKVGRPLPGLEVYTPEIVAEMCERIMDGEALGHICRDTHMPARKTVYIWLRDKPEFYEKYLQAKRIQMEHYVEEVIEISDDTSQDLLDMPAKDGKPAFKIMNKAKIYRDQLRVNTRKWIASKLSPMLYGDKAQIQVTGAIGAYDISKLGDEELAQLEKILTQVAINVGATAALPAPDAIPPGNGEDIEGFALPGDDSEREPEAKVRQAWWLD